MKTPFLFSSILVLCALGVSSACSDARDTAPSSDKEPKKDASTRVGDDDDDDDDDDGFDGGPVVVDDAGPIASDDASPPKADASIDAGPTFPPGITTTLDGITSSDPTADAIHYKQANFLSRIYSYGTAKSSQAGVWTRVILNAGYPAVPGEYPCVPESQVGTAGTGFFEFAATWRPVQKGDCKFTVKAASAKSLTGTITGTLTNGKTGKTAPVSVTFNYVVREV